MAKRQVIDLTTYSALDAWAICINEMYKALKRAGMSTEIAMGIIVEPSAYPDWIMPKPTLTPFHYEDDDDEDED